MKKQLVLLTIEYPDPLLELEIPILVSAFEKIHILPSKIVGPVKLHDNVLVKQIFEPVQLKTPKWLVLKHFLFINRLYRWALFRSGNAKTYLQYWKSFIGYIINESEKVKPLKVYIEENKLNDALFYDYWLVNSTLTLAELKRQHIIKHTVARAHGFDLYAERFKEKEVPFQAYRIHFLDALFVISKHGLTYLRNRLPARYHTKLWLSYLGVDIKSMDASQVKGKGRYTIVSCSSIIPLKRLTLLLEALKFSTLDITWIHYGDGPLLPELQTASKSLPANVQVEFAGAVENTIILEFFRSNYIDLFVSVSEKEGLPVSMMEAASCGIPILACDIFGIPEIVNPDTGVLVSKDIDPKKLSAVIEHACQHKFDRHYIRRICGEKFNAKENYSQFINNLEKIVE